jgi:hypothetical protein
MNYQASAVCPTWGGNSWIADTAETCQGILARAWERAQRGYYDEQVMRQDNKRLVKKQSPALVKEWKRKAKGPNPLFALVKARRMAMLEKIPYEWSMQTDLCKPSGLPRASFGFDVDYLVAQGHLEERRIKVGRRVYVQLRRKVIDSGTKQ